jgi:hypothetical protein
VIAIKTYYIEKMDKHKIIGRKIQLENDNIKIYMDLEKGKNTRKLVKRLLLNETNNVVIDKELITCEKLINLLRANDIKIFDGKWLEKYLILDILEYIINKKQIIKAETEIAITANEITDLLIEMIKILSKQYKKLTIVTNHIEKLRKIEKEIKEKEGILIILSNNKNKSLLKSQVIINMDFNQELINQYKIYEEAIIINAEENIRIDAIRFNGIVINDYEIEIGRKEFIWRDGIEKYRQRDLIEAELYVRDTYKNIRKKIQKNNIKIKELYGINGIVKI